MATEEIYNKNVNRTDKKSEEPIESSPNTVQENQQDAKQPESSGNYQETIDPHQVSPSYESMYDGTVLPPEHEDLEPPKPSYSTQTLQDSAKTDEPVQLNVYPNILQSTFSALSGILSGSDDDFREAEEDDEEEEEKTKDVDSSDETAKEEVAEKTPEIEKPDESSPDNSEEVNAPEDASLENKTKEAEGNLLQPEDNGVVSDVVSESPETDSSRADISETPSESDVTGQDQVMESTDQLTDSPLEVNAVDTDEKVEHNVESSNAIDPVKTESTEDEVSPAPDESNAKIPKTDPANEANPTSEEPQNDNVPKPAETVSVATDTAAVENNAVPAAPVEDTVAVADNKIDANDTSVNFSSVEDTITPEVPLKQEVEKESATPPPREPFVPNEESPQTNITAIESTPIADDNPEIGQNSTEPSVIVEETQVIDNSSSKLEKPLESNDTVVDNNNNAINDSSYTPPDVLTYPHNDSVVESPESSFQSAESARESIVDIPSTSSFGEFLGNRNLLNAGKGFQYDDCTYCFRCDSV